MDVLSAPGETMQQKVWRRDVTPDLLLIHPNTTYIHLKAVKTLKHVSITLEKKPENT
jgi:hypothetical protein